ncbi:hypothetical protein VSDG_08085 [Cytospora chrysosperma]|uniref:25S rRNA (Uridine(2843)-N(3))-methyltransferase n=1 Tax=Cytospora chrysosperma TaxID=252740 RepID=A0A423VF68_CYTCH|nr:hypothetical protein VSDG_08085 [Valsa sordida]
MGRPKGNLRSSDKTKPAPQSSSKPKSSSSKPSIKQANSARLNDGSETEHPVRVSIAQRKVYQQKVLNVFQGSFNSVLSSDNFTTILQEVKTALFNRDFDRAFGNEEYNEAYAARWSPTRALCYASALDRIRPHLDELSQTKKAEADGGVETEEKTEANLNVVSIGGAAAEIVAFGCFLGQQDSPLSSSIALLDVAPWANVVEKLRAGLATRPPISKYASAAIQAANTPIVDLDRLAGVTFKQTDVLSLKKDEVSSLVGSTQPALITLLFTLNELFTVGGMGKTTSFLLNLTQTVPAGSLLLVIDSPGSYSEATIGKESKRYPMQWLLDKILLETTGAWEKVESEDSVWFRLSQDLEYPIPLEDMRYQMHLYRASGKEDDTG